MQLSIASDRARLISRPRFASGVVSPDHQTKSRIVAGPWLRKYRSVSSASASSRGSRLALGARSATCAYVNSLPRRGPLQIDPFELREYGQQGKRHPSGDDTGAAEMCPELAAGQRVSIEHSLEDSSRAGSSGDVEALPAEVMGEGLMHARRCQLQHPADVGPGNEVPGRAHHVCTQDLSSVEGSIDLPLGGRLRQSKSEPPLRGAELLRLHRAQPGHEIGGPAMARSCDALIVESQLRNRRHAGGQTPSHVFTCEGV